MESEIQKLYKPASKCRIYTWPFEQLYFGSIHEPGTVLYSTPVLRVGLGGTFDLRIGKGQWKKCICACIPAGVTHEVLPTTGVIVKYWVEKESNHYAFLQNFFTETDRSSQQKSTNNIIALFRRIYGGMLCFNDAKKELDYLFFMQKNIEPTTDARILCISRIIRNEPDYNFSIESLASEVDLSSSRLLHLIKEQTGTSYRKFRTWQRVRYAISIFGSAHSLTYASVQAGFNDSAHFSRCFKAIYGATPSSVHKTLEMYEVKK